MKGRNYELPPEARAVVEQVRRLEVQADEVRRNLGVELDRIKQAAAHEGREARRALASELGDFRRAAEDERAAVALAQADLARDRGALEALLAGRVRGVEFIANAWADYERARADALGEALQFKSRPAFSAALAVRAQGQEMAALRRELKRSEWVLRLYEWHFPWLTDLRDFEEEQAYVAGEEDTVAALGTAGDGQPVDPAQQWISDEEYRALPEVERNQRALDRYLRSRKTPWELGRDYERYVGYLRESAGARVSYQGIFAGLEDLGRDLLADRDGVIEVIQCKRWAQHKTIHEKHVFQLFGTVVAARIEYPDRKITGTFTTTTTLSERAREFASQLGIRVEEGVPLADYPRIKCNVSRNDELIYHLPFDQQYDSTVIEPKRGEAWAATTAEAEALGFRRAWRWKRIATPA